MSTTPKIKTEWYPHELHYLKQNFYEMTWSELLFAINEMRDENDHVLLGAVRHQCHRMGLKKFQLIHWSKPDENFLIKNYKLMGNIEISEFLNQKRRSSRCIDGKKVFRQFNKKHIEKKIKLLGLKRSSDDLKNIIKRNREQGRGFQFTTENNAWSLGIRQAAAEEEVRIWTDSSGSKRRYVKVEGKFIPYTPWFYKNFMGPIPAGFQVHHLDSDTLNDDLDNLRCSPRMSLHSTEKLQLSIELLNGRENTILLKIPTISYDTRRKELQQMHTELNRIRRIRSAIQNKLFKRLENKNLTAPARHSKGQSINL